MLRFELVLVMLFLGESVDSEHLGVFSGLDRTLWLFELMLDVRKIESRVMAIRITITIR